MTTYLTSNLELVYCFSKNLAFTDEQYVTSLELLKESILLSSRLYKVKLYTDNSTFQDVKQVGIPVENLGDLDLIFIDDFKVYILDLLKENELYIDSDVLLYSKLNIDQYVDLIFDFKDRSTSKWYTDSFRKLKDTLVKSKIDDISLVEMVPNLGFLKINSKELLQEYKSNYYHLREYLLNDIGNRNPISQFSMILGQYLLGAVLNKGKFSYFSISSENDSSIYRHLAGPAKFRKQQII